MDTPTPKYENKYDIHDSCLFVAPGTVILKSRIVGMFDIGVRRIAMLVQKLIHLNKCLDATRMAKRRSVLLLEDGSIVLSPLELTELIDQFGG